MNIVSPFNHCARPVGRLSVAFNFRIACIAVVLFLCAGIAPFSATADEPRFKDPAKLLDPPASAKAAAPNAANSTTNAPAANSTNSAESLDDKHKLVIGDRVSFRIVEDEEDPKGLLVTDSGELEIPYLGRIGVVGKTCKELARVLKTDLEKDYYKQATVLISVDIMSKSHGKVYIVGPVRSPGPQEIPSDETFTLSKAIMRAGGFSDFADKHNVRVTRKPETAGGQEQKFTVNVGDILEKGRSDLDMVLAPDDLIYIPEKKIRL